MVSALGAHSPKLDAVRDLLTTRGRREQGRFAFEGPTLLGEALRSGLPVEAIYATEPAYEALEPGVREALDCPVYVIAAKSLRRISDLETPPGILAVAPARLLPAEQLLKGTKTALMLAGVADPGNAGTLIRSAEIFGVDSVLFAEGGVEPYNPKVVRAAMGAIFRERLAMIEPGAVVDLARQHAFRVVAAERGGVPLNEYAFSEHSILVVGNERRGVGAIRAWDDAVAIPQRGLGESLNAAVAGSIILYEFARHQGDLSRPLSTRQKP
jgi:RNA methyltransferase, TrmH family